MEAVNHGVGMTELNQLFLRLFYFSFKERRLLMHKESDRKANKGIKNLMPPRSTDEARERGKKGGVKSGEARREKKLLKESLSVLLETEEGQEKICTALFKQAQRGNIKAFEVIRDTIGQKPVDKSEVILNVKLEDVL